MEIECGACSLARARALQNEAHSPPWSVAKSCSCEAGEYATLEWVDWFNHRRLFEPVGNMPPAELEASYYQSTSQLRIAA